MTAKTAAPKQKLPKPDHSAMVHIDPLTVLPDNLVRASLLESRITEMSDSILKDANDGGQGVRLPVEVSILTAEEQKEFPGRLYRLETGGYRTAGLIDANKRHKLGLPLPAIVIPAADAKSRIARQLSENRDRQDMTYLDIARAIDNMQRAGCTSLEIRESFPRTTKGVMGPASASWVSHVHSFLKFPEHIQAMIHNGEMLYEAAYGLLNKPQDKWAAIVQTIKDEREKAIETEKKREAAFLGAEKKRITAEQKEQDRAKELLDAEALVEQSKNALDEKQAAFDEASKLAAEAYRLKKSASGEAKGAAAEAFSTADKKMDSAKAELATAKKTHEKNETALNKVRGVVKAAADIKEEDAAKTAPAPEPQPTGKGKTAPAKTTKEKPVTGKEVDKAAAAHGAAPKAKPFLQADTRKLIESIKYLSDVNTQKNAHLLGQLLLDAIDGKLGTFDSGVDAQVQQAVVKLTGGKVK